MKQPWKMAALGGAIGACVAVSIVFAAALAGWFPSPSDQQFHAYLMSHPSVAIDMVQKAQLEEDAARQRQLQASVDKIGLSSYFNPKLAYVAGPANARHSLVEFFDYNCAHCRNSYPIVQKFFNAHRKDTRFAFIELPIFGKDSNSAARAALAARRQPEKYIPYHFALMSTDGAVDTNRLVAAAEAAGLDLNRLTVDLKDPAVNKAMTAAHALAARTGVTGTPFFIIDGKPHEGEITLEDLGRIAMR